MSDAIVLVAHGARDPEWARPIEAIAARLRNLLPDSQVAISYLELMRPDIETAVCRLVEGGARRVRVVPVFLAQGGHVKRDLPAKVDALRTKLTVTHADLQIDLETAIGEQSQIIDAIAACISRNVGER